MPKQLVEIRGFHNGIISAPSETDVPLDAAVYSLNVDPMAEDGKLCGIPTDTTVIASFPGTQMEWIEETGGGKERTLFYHDPTANLFKYYTDFEGAMNGPFSMGPTLTPDNDIISPVQQGHALHIGMGSTQAAKWVGYVQHDQFGVAPTTDLVVYDAALGTYGLETNGIYKADYYSTFSRYIGMEYGGTQLLTINIAGGAILKGSSDDGVTFTRLQALCHSKTGDGYVWVYDNDGTTCGTLYEVRLNGSTYSITKTVTIVSWGGFGLEEPNTYTCTDLIQGTGTVGEVWFSFHNLGGGVKITAKRSFDPTEVSPPDGDLKCGYPTLVFKTATSPADGASVTPTNMSPSLNGTDRVGIAGRFYLGNDVDETYHYINLVTLRKPFFHLDPSDADKGDNVGWFCSFKTGTSSPRIWTESVTDGEWWRIGLCFFMIDSAMVAGPSAIPNATPYLDFRSVRLAGDPTGSSGVTSFYDKSITNFQALLTKEAVGTDYFVIIAAGKGSGSAIYSFGDSELAFSGSDNFPSSNLRFLEDDAGHEYQHDSMGINLPKVTISASYQGIVPIFVEQGGYGLAQAVLADTGTLPAAVTYVVASNFIVSPRDTSVTAEGMRSDRTYRYFMAWEYDGFQIGPLSEALCEHKPAEDGKAVFVDFYFTAAEIPNPRVSGIVVLRSYYEGLVSTQEDSLPRVIGRIDISTLTETKRLEGFTTDYYYYTVKDSNAPAETFEDLAGYPHTAEAVTPFYGLSCAGGGQLMVTDCGNVDGIADATNYGFFSEVGRYDQFDLLNKFVVFSEKPNAIVYWRGRFFAFAAAKFWRINPAGPMIEDEYDGIGCQGPQCVLANEYGLFVAGTNNIYLDEGQGLHPIGFPILTSSPTTLIGWNERYFGLNPTVTFDMKRKAFVVLYPSQGAYYCWAYSLAKRRWDLWQAPNNGETLSDSIIGSEGEMYVATGQGLYHYLGGTTYRDVDWWSRVIDAGTNTIDKKWYKIRAPFQGDFAGYSLTVKDYDGNAIASTDADESDMFVRTMDEVRKRGIQVRLEDLPGDCKVDSIGIIYRPFIGVR